MKKEKSICNENKMKYYFVLSLINQLMLVKDITSL